MNLFDPANANDPPASNGPPAESGPAGARRALDALAWRRGGNRVPPPADRSARAFGRWAFRAAWRTYGDPRIVFSLIAMSSLVLLTALIIDLTSSNHVAWLDVAVRSAAVAILVRYAVRAAAAVVFGTGAYALGRSGPVVRSSAHFWADLLRSPYQTTVSTRPAAVVRMVLFSPIPGFRLFLVAAPFGVIGWAVGATSPSSAETVMDTTWIWSIVATAGIGLVFGLRACGVRYRHPTDPGMGGGGSMIGVLIAAAALSGAIVLGARPDGLAFGVAGLAIGCFCAAVLEALIRGPRGAGLRVARVPIGYERDILFLPRGADRWIIWIERRTHLDPLYQSLPDDPQALTRTLLPFPEDGRDTYSCEPTSGTGIDSIARAIIWAFWGIEQAHVADVRRVASAVSARLVEREEFRVTFSELIELGVTTSPAVETGLVPVWPLPVG